MLETDMREENPQGADACDEGSCHEEAGEPFVRKTDALYYVYMLRCEGETLYTGITTNVVRRMREHLAGAPLGARYTQTHRPLELAALWRTEGRAAASRLEYRIKRLPASEKRALAASPETVRTLEGIVDAGAFVPVPASDCGRLWAQAQSQNS